MDHITDNARERLVVPTVLDEQELMPTYGSVGAAGADLRSREEVTLMPGDRKLVKTGTYVAIPEGYVGMVCPRSGLAAKNGITIVNAPGIIDEDYRGEIGVILLNTDQNAKFKIEKGDRIAQLVFVPYIQAAFDVVDELDETERGDGGYGHTGVK